MDISDSLSNSQVISYQTVLLQHKSTEQRTIAIPNLPIKLNEYYLEEHFRQWSIIEYVMCDRENQDFAIVLFKDARSVQKALSVEHVLRGISLSVEPVDFEAQTNKENYFRALYLLKDIKRIQLLELLKKCATIEDQLEILQHELCLIPKSLHYRLSLRDGFHELFSKYFPQSDLQLFGSSVGGYGFEGADIDIFLKLPEDYFAPGTRTISFTPDLPDIEAKNVNLKLLTTESRLKLLMKILKENMSCCKDIVFCPSKMCPLVKFQYIDDAYSLPCDLSAYIQTAVVCSKLMSLYHDLDPRVTPLMTFLRYWSECQNIIKSEKKLKTFTFTLLVVFFLQNRNPSVLPTIDQLRQLADTRSFIGKWDVSFCDKVERIPKSNNRQMVKELVKEFFYFYSTFDFANEIICVRLGKSFSKEKFFSDPANRGFCPREISIQHFFELSRNTTFSCSKNFRKELCSKFIVAAQICDSFQITDCQLDSRWGLVQLLEEIVFFNDREKNLVSCILCCNRQMTRLITKRKRLATLWLEKVCSSLQKVISIALCSEYEVVYSSFHAEPSSVTGKEVKEVSSQSNKTEIFNGESLEDDESSADAEENPEASKKAKNPVETYEENILLLLRCKVWDNIWVRRKCLKDQLSEEVSLDLEREVSRCVIRVHDSKTFVRFECTVENMQTEFPAVIIKMKPYTRMNYHKTIPILSLLFRLIHKCMRDFCNAEDTR